MNTGSIPDSSNASGAAGVVSRSLLGSRTLWVAIVVTLLGAVAWGYSIATQSGAVVDAPAASTLAGADPTVAPRSERFIDKSAPRTVRYGLSFLAAFVLAYLVKKVIKSVLIVAGLIIAAIAGLKLLGVFDYDWSSAQRQVEEGVEFAKQESGRLARVVTEYLPSSVSAGLGAIFGARRG